MYRLTIWLIAAAFVFSGVAAHAWGDLPSAPTVVAQVSHGASAAASQAVPSGRVDTAALPNGGQVQTYHNCLKCCGAGTCNLANMPSAATTAVTFSDAAVTFRLGQRHLVGHPVALDPGIPKTIV